MKTNDNTTFQLCIFPRTISHVKLISCKNKLLQTSLCGMFLHFWISCLRAKFDVILLINGLFSILLKQNFLQTSARRPAPVHICFYGSSHVTVFCSRMFASRFSWRLGYKLVFFVGVVIFKAKSKIFEYKSLIITFGRRFLSDIYDFICFRKVDQYHLSMNQFQEKETDFD